MSEFVDLVDRSLRDATRTEFDRRVDEQAARLADDLPTGRLDSPGFGIGIELELYAVDGSNRLTRLPDAVFDGHCERELGLHNAELQTSPDPLDDGGIAEQARKLHHAYHETQRAARRTGAELVRDAMWSVPPSEGSYPYLTAVQEREGVAIAENMTPSARYYAIDNDLLERAGGTVSLSVPGFDREFPTILFESLASSVQPHLQVPDVTTFPRYYNTALRTLGPVLALATNSPLLPADLYDADDPYRLLDRTYHELRIPVFEQSINEAWHKVRIPDDIDDVADALDRLAADPTCAPFLREWVTDDPRETFPEQFWELDHKRGTYWRWLRTVVGGQPVDGGNRWSVRLEYRPLPTQPTIVDNVGFLCLIAGLVHGLVAADHPLSTLDRDAADRGFYDVVERGLDADLAWITADGDRTSDQSVIYDEVFGFARRGLREQGVSPETIEEYLVPIEERWERRATPSRWKLARVRESLDAGEAFADSVAEMQDEYRRRADSGEPFSRWPSVR